MAPEGMQHFHVKGKLALRYIGPFRILARRGEVSYKLELPEEMYVFHDVFHVSLLRKCLHVPEKNHTYQNVDLRTKDLNNDITYCDRPLRVLDENVRVTRKRAIKFLKIQWTNHSYVPSKKTKMHCDLWMFSYDFAIRVFP